MESNSKEALAELQKKIDEMQKDSKEQQDRIDQINDGNELEKQHYQELADAYEHYLTQLKSIGAVDRGDGTYVIPEGAKDKYNEMTKEYQQAADKFNVYWKGRQSELNEYNKATLAYNQRAEENNQAINDLINEYQLADYMKEKELPIPSQSRAGLRDLAGAPNQIESP